MMPMPTAPVFVLIHSPLVGALTWQPVADLLEARGFPVVVPSLVGVVDGGPPYYPKLASRVAEVVHAKGLAEPLILVAHSGAGALVPSVAVACDGKVEAAVLVDAILPHPGVSWLDSAGPEWRERLRTLAADSWLPPWDQWFPPGTLDALLPDPDRCSDFIAELPRLPLAYFEERAPLIPDLPARYGFLQLSDAYQDVAEEAQRRGWPTLREPADHLAMLTRPEMILDRLAQLVERVSVTVDLPHASRNP